MKRPFHFQTLIKRVFLLCLTGCLLASTPPPSTRLVDNLAAKRPMQALYQIESQASQSGWTTELATTAGDIWEGLGDLSRAAAYWEVAVRIQSPDFAVVRHLAQANLELGHWSQAVINLSRLVDMTDDNWAHFQLGVLQSVYDGPSALGHFELAARDPQFQAVTNQLLPLMTEPSDIARAMRTGIVLAGETYWPAAEYVFQYAAALTPILPEALAYTALARDQQGKDGHSQIEQAITLAPDNAQVRYLQGLHFQLVGDGIASLSALQQAVKLAPLNPAFAAELATTYNRVGDAANAEYWFKAAVTLSNNDVRFQTLLDAFYSQTSTPVTGLTP